MSSREPCQSRDTAALSGFRFMCLKVALQEVFKVKYDRACIVRDGASYIVMCFCMFIAYKFIHCYTLYKCLLHFV